jgi:hypothetical protein
MDDQSAREPLLDVETKGPVENEQVQDGIHEQNGKFLCGVFRTSVVPVIFSDIHSLCLPANRTNKRV